MASGRSKSVINSLFGDEARDTDIHSSNASIVMESIREAAEVLHRANYKEEIEDVKSNFIKLIEIRNELKLVVDSCQQLQAQYKISEDPTTTSNFKDLLCATLKKNKNQDHDIQSDWDYCDFLKVISDKDKLQSIDDDFALDESLNELPPNVSCPLCGKQLLELEDPVEDQKGIVYEKAFIVDHIQKKGGSALSPVAGATHQIMLRDLRPSRMVMRMKKKKILTKEQIEGDDNIIDVD